MGIYTVPMLQWVWQIYKNPLCIVEEPQTCYIIKFMVDGDLLHVSHET